MNDNNTPTPRADARSFWGMTEGPLPPGTKWPPEFVRELDHQLLGPCVEWRVVTLDVPRQLERELARFEEILEALRKGPTPEWRDSGPERGQDYYTPAETDSCFNRRIVHMLRSLADRKDAPQ